MRAYEIILISAWIGFGLVFGGIGAVGAASLIETAWGWIKRGR